MKTPAIDPEDFRIAVTEMNEEALVLLVQEISEPLLELEAEDFFGPEGINRRFRV